MGSCRRQPSPRQAARVAPKAAGGWQARGHPWGSNASGGRAAGGARGSLDLPRKYAIKVLKGGDGCQGGGGTHAPGGLALPYQEEPAPQANQM